MKDSVATDGQIVFSGTMDTSYSQMYVVSGEYESGLLTYDAFRGQNNGLCGGAVPGGLFLYVGVQAGNVHITVEVHEQEPPVDDAWEEIVEASCSFDTPRVFLEGWAGSSCLALPLHEGHYRARYCITGFKQSDTVRIFGDPSVERYSLVFWPAPCRADEVLKVTHAIAQFKHDRARTLGPA